MLFEKCFLGDGKVSDWQQRQRALLGDQGCEKLKNARVAVVGLGGVGSAAAEALVRAGVGNMLIMDFDTVQPTDRNRQLIALSSLEGKYKSEVAAERYLDINPHLQLTAKNQWLDADTVGELVDYGPDFVVDAIDKVTHKLTLIEEARKQGISIISSMGTGKRLDPSAFIIGDIGQTAGCGDPLARIMRRELRKRGIDSLTVLYSTEEPVQCEKGIIASISFVPPVAGYLIAGHVIREIALGI